MPLPGPTNVSVTIYRSFNAANPYPADATMPAATGVQGYLKHHMKNGRFGKNAAGVHWTHLLYVDAAVDIRDAFNTWASGAKAEDATLADTIIIDQYPLAGRC